VELHQRPQAARGALLQSECLRKTHGVQAFGSCSRAEDLAGMAELRPLLPGRGGAGGEKPLLLLHNPQALPCQSNVQAENLSCARGQVVIARPPVLTPPWRYYRRSLVSKGRFAIISINVICVGICFSLPKRRYRVVIDYVGDPLRHRGKAGC
jgi:hypothetical protein